MIVFDCLPIDRNRFYATNDHNLECDTDIEMYEYHPNKLDNLNVKYFRHTENNDIEFSTSFCDQWKIIIIKNGSILTRWPLVFSCNGKHMLQTSQWKKLFRPPIRQMPHPSQWYWSLSSSSNKLQIRHVYWNWSTVHPHNTLIFIALSKSSLKCCFITFPNRTPQFSHSACTFCLVSHLMQINSVKVFRSKWWSSFSSWQ